MTDSRNSIDCGAFEIAGIAAATAAATIDPASVHAPSLFDEFRFAHAAHQAALAEFDRVASVPEELRTRSADVMGFEVATPELDASGTPRAGERWVAEAASLESADEYLDGRPSLRSFFRALAPVAREYERRTGLARQTIATAAARLVEAERRMLESKAAM